MQRLMSFVVVALVLAVGARAADTTVDDLRKEVDKLRKEVVARQDQPKTSIGNVDSMVAGKYGPNTPVTTKAGKLAIGGAFQIWYQAIQNDHHDVVDTKQLGAGGGQNETFDNDTFRLRRIVLKFAMDIHENISSFVLVDTATAYSQLPAYPSNQGTIHTVSNRSPAAIQTGAGNINLFLLDAWINYHGVIPHHDFRIGQFKRKMGDEGSRPSDLLDFVDRSYLGNIAHLSYDSGIEGHGTWWEDRLQYWFGVQNGPSNVFAVRLNRTDDNDAKNVFGSIQVRPLWKNETWGGLELGFSVMGGKGGESATKTPGEDFLNGLNRRQTSQLMQYAWIRYAPGGPVKGWWLESEWAKIRDRLNPNQVMNGDDNFIVNPSQFTTQSWYFATGYKLCDSIWKDTLPCWVRPFEFTYRYETIGNIFYNDLSQPDTHMDIFHTTVNTAGVNYNFKGHNAKVMVNYNWVKEETDVDNGDRQLRNVRNDNLAVQFQVAF